jgi:hypothetical protein
MSLWAGNLSAQQNASAAIIENGRAEAAVIIPAERSGSVDFAAAELVRFVAKSTGVTLPVIEESKDENPSVRTIISIGPTRMAQKAGLTGETRQGEFFSVRWAGDTVFLLGNDSALEAPIKPTPVGRRPPPGQAETFLGSLDATVWFIENSLGGGYLFPGEAGTSYPFGKSLAATRTDKAFRTPYLLRSLRNFAAGVDFRRIAPDVLAREEQARRQSEVGQWLFLRGLGYPRAIKSGHAFTDWYEKYKDSEPDIFAKFPDGHRGTVPASPFFQYSDPRWVKFCEANPKVTQLAGQEMRRFFGASPESMAFSVAENDGRWDGFCVCDECKKLDDPSAAALDLRYARQSGERYVYPYVYLTDRYAKKWGKLAEVARAEFPGKYLIAYAYGATDSPPRSTPLPGNLLIQYVPTIDLMDSEKKWTETTLGTWDRWHEAGANLIYRPNLHYAGASLPLVYARRLARELSHFHAKGLMGCDYDQMPADWGSQGINHFVLARLLFEPGLDPDALMDEFCRKGYGPASGPMRAYFGLLEAETERALNKETRTWGISFARALDKPETARRIQALFTEAAALSKGDDRTRVDMAHDAWQYARLFAKIGTPETNRALLDFLNARKSSPTIDYVWLADRGVISGLRTGKMNLDSHLRLLNPDRSARQGANKGGNTGGL